MKNIMLYLTEEDLKAVIEWLNKDEDIAYLAKGEDNKWIAKDKIKGWLTQGKHILWHTGGGKLCILDQQKEETVIDDPWKGWIDLFPEESSYPHVSPTFSGVVYFNVNIIDFEFVEGNKQESIGISSFEWIGNRYKIIGSPADFYMEQWWKKLQSFVKRVAIKIPRSEGMQPEIFVFPKALQEINHGKPRSINP